MPTKARKRSALRVGPAAGWDTAHARRHPAPVGDPVPSAAPFSGPQTGGVGRAPRPVQLAHRRRRHSPKQDPVPASWPSYNKVPSLSYGEVPFLSPRTLRSAGALQAMSRLVRGSCARTHRRSAPRRSIASFVWSCPQRPFHVTGLVRRWGVTWFLSAVIKDRLQGVWQ